jgi:predicted RNase H-like HicB family nuclease
MLRMRDITSDRFRLVNTSAIKRPLYDGCRPCYCLGTMIVPLTKVQVRRDEDGVWIAKSTLLPGCHAHGKDRGEAVLRFQQAAKAHLEALLETGRPVTALT